MAKNIIIVFVLLFCSGVLAEGKVYSEKFKTLNVHEGFKPPSGLASLNSAFQESLKILPESMIVTSVLSLMNNKVGLSEKQKERLSTVFQKAYMEILKDDQMKSIPSALSYSLSGKKPDYGHYFIYLPDKVTSKTKQIVFLHGYGGNFLIYIYVLKKAFKNSIIIVPSWGCSWALGNYGYLKEVYSDIKQKFSVKIVRPVLMAISAGGGAAFEYYNKAPERFELLISFATCPYRRTIRKMKPELSVMMICGRQDKRFPWQGIKRRIWQTREKVNKFRLKILPDDHFFFLSSQDAWVKFVKENTDLR